MASVTMASESMLFVIRSFSEMSIALIKRLLGSRVLLSLSESFSGQRSSWCDSASDCTIWVPSTWMSLSSNSDRKKAPPCLSGVQLLHGSEIGEILVIRQDGDWVWQSKEIVAPFSEGPNDGQ